MAFWTYDILFLIIFILGTIYFIRKNRKKVDREGLMYLYKTQLGVKIFDRIAIKFPKTLNILKYVIIIVGYLLMITMVYLLWISVYKYIADPLIAQAIKSPPLVLLIPYFPTIFGLKSMFPPFYFTYFIIAVAIVMLVHEGAHGIFMRVNKVKIKSTGVALLGPILGAFVEQDENDMEKKSKTAQMSILGAGVFANIITAIIFFFIWMLVFTATFVPSGATFDLYSVKEVNIGSISMIGEIKLDNPTRQSILNIINNLEGSVNLEGLDLKTPINFTEDLIEIKTNNQSYFMILGALKSQLEQETDYVILYYDFPAIRKGLIGTIIEVNGNKIRYYKDLVEILSQHKPGDNLRIVTKYTNPETKITQLLAYDLTLAKDPDNPERGVIGISHRGIAMNTRLDSLLFLTKDPFTEYQIRNEFLEFLYYLVFWIFLINLLVGLFNMLPFAILDGGRFFYLTVLGITKSEKVSKFVYKTLGYLILLSLILIMLIWVLRVYIL